MAPSTRLVELIDWFKGSHPEISDAEIARRTGMTPANLSQWRSNGLRGWPARARLDALALTIGRPYREILDAALSDTGYADGANSVAPAPGKRGVSAMRDAPRTGPVRGARQSVG